MSAQIEERSDADKAVDILLAGLSWTDTPSVTSDFIRRKLRQAYLLGRTDQAAKNYDELLKRIQEQA